MKRLARILIPVAIAFALPWNVWSGTENDENLGSPSRPISLVEFPVRHSLPMETTPGGSPENTQEVAAPRSLTRIYGYGNFAAGGCNHGYTILGGGGGGEGFPFRRLGIGGDLGYYQFIDDVGFGLFSANVAMHLGDRSETARMDPFLSVSPGFYSAGDDGSGAALGLGGGLNYWFGDRIGLHTDLRIAMLGTEEAVALFRIGVAFR